MGKWIYPHNGVFGFFGIILFIILLSALPEAVLTQDKTVTAAIGKNSIIFAAPLATVQDDRSVPTPKPTLPSVLGDEFNFNDGTTQGWTWSGIYDEQGNGPWPNLG